MHVWVVGRGGLLGSAVSEAFVGHRQHMSRPVPWTDRQSVHDALAAELALFCDAVAVTQPWSIVWCAGVGVVGTSDAALAYEEEILTRFVENLRRRHPEGPGGFVLASSVGVYAGSAEPPFDENTVAVPLNSYGATKLRQEMVARTVLTGSVPFAVARISTLYGPGQNILKPQGLITQVCLRAALRQPIVLFVPLDTLRDYVFVDDAARRMAELAETLTGAVEGHPMIRVVATEQAVSIAEILGVAKAVSRHPVGVVHVPRAVSSQHVRDLRVRSRYSHESLFSGTPLRRGVQIVYDDIVIRTRRGELVGAAAAITL